MNDLIYYLKKIFSNWVTVIGIIPTILGLVNTYFDFSLKIGVNLSDKYIFIITVIFFVLALIYSSYKVWKEELDKIKHFEDNKPKLDVVFDNDLKEIEINSTITKRKLIKDEKEDDLTQEEKEELKKISLPSSSLSSIISGKFNFFQGPTQIEEEALKEIEEEFLPFKIKLNNLGNIRVEDVRITFESISNKLNFIREYPNIYKNQFPEIKSYSKIEPSENVFLSSNNRIQYWCEEADQHFPTRFPEIYVKCEKEGEVILKYEITGREIDKNKITGELKIISSPKYEVKEYKSQDEIDEIESTKVNLLNQSNVKGFDEEDLE
ncbi:MAG: hypothetical protein ACLFPL_01210 [Candidatus Nanoarchaeia archaeon]